MRLTALFGIISLTIAACAQAPLPSDQLRGAKDDDTDTDTGKKSSKKKPAPSTDTPAQNDTPAPPPAPTADQPPTLTSVSPDSIAVGTATDVEVTLNGTKFPSTVQVSLGADKIPATFISPEQVKVRIPADKLKATGQLRLSVVAKAGLESNALTFTVANPTSTTITTVTPANVILGTADPVNLKVSGSGYTTASVIKFNGAALTTTFTSASELSATVPASAILDAGRVSVTVALGSDVISLPFAFEVRNPSPTASTLNPTSVASGAAATITVNGTGFTKGSNVMAGGQPVSTTFISSTSLRATVPANLLAASGSVNLTVQNGQPGGGTSNNVALAVSATTTSSSSSGGNQGANPNCAYQCKDYNYAPDQCYAGYYCISSGTYAGCLGTADCGAAQGAAGGAAGGGAAGGGAAGGNGAGAASCSYKCADYGYAKGECFQDWLCLDTGEYAGCLAQTLCN